MKVQVLDDAGLVKFDFDPSLGGLGPIEAAERTAISNALHDATQFLAQDHHVIASITSDISAAIGRIEQELGAHPAFTWAQTKLSHAAAHLEAYVKGTWTEPAPTPGITVDQRGVIVEVAPTATA